MKAVVYYGKEDLRLEEIPVPEPGPGEMLVRVDACGICPTDLKKIQKGFLSGPRVFGHEIAGTVADLGRGTTGWRNGQRVAVHHHVPCGTCFYCQRKLYAQCARYKQNGTTAGFEPAGGGYAEYVRVLDWIVAEGVVAIPDGVPAEEAAFVEPVNTCLKAVEGAGLATGETVLVVGQGPIGLLLTQLARHAGTSVLASEPTPERRALAERLGAEAVLKAGPDVPELVRQRTGGRGADCVFVAAVGPEAMAQAVAAARPGGRILSFAATSPGETAEVDFGLLTTSEKQILTAYSSSIELQARAAALVFERHVRVCELVSDRVPMARALDAFRVAMQPEARTLKVVLQMTPGTEGR